MKLRDGQPGRGWLGAAILAIVLAGGGCGGASSPPATSTARSSSSSPDRHEKKNGRENPGAKAIPTPGPTGIPPARAAVRVIMRWSSALARGDVRAAARYFALPSVMINGPDAAGDMTLLTIHSRAQAVAANAALPCGARFISADQRGRYVNALFRLTGRPGLGAGCGTGIGQTARTNMVISNGLIVEWSRAPDDPGDHGSPASPPPGASAPPPNGPAA